MHVRRQQNRSKGDKCVKIMCSTSRRTSVNMVAVGGGGGGGGGGERSRCEAMVAWRCVNEAKSEP